MIDPPIAGVVPCHADPPSLGEFRWIDLGVWFVRRNPFYLLSAAAMAIAARLLLVDPDTRTGDIAHILLTLAVIQLYELAVTAIVLLLSRFRRSPEGLPSLLIVGTVFWTAPFAATAEMTAQHGPVGIGLSLAAALLAVAEFESVRRGLNLRISAFGRAAALATMLLIALLPALLLPSAKTGRASEQALLAGWWIVAAIVILVARSARAATDRRYVSAGVPLATVGSIAISELRSARCELVWLSALIIIAGVQLVGMNHAFFLHATPAYAAPIVVLLAHVLIAGRETLARASAVLSIGVFVLPTIAVLLAGGGLDAKYVEPQLHWLLARPLAAVSLLTGLVWWQACRSGCGVLFLHLGSGAIALAIGLFMSAQSDTVPAGGAIASCAGHSIDVDLRFHVAFAACIASAYFAITAVIRKSRTDGVVALALAAGSVLLATWRLVPADAAIAVFTLFWFWFLALHVASPRPPMRQLACVVAFGVLATFWIDAQGPSRAWAWWHAPAIPLALAAAWFITRRCEYAILAWTATAAPLTYLSVRGVSQIRLSGGAIAAGSAFALLIAGACTSWFKGRGVAAQSTLESSTVHPGAD